MAAVSRYYFQHSMEEVNSKLDGLAEEVKSLKAVLSSSSGTQTGSKPAAKAAADNTTSKEGE